jgi:glutathionylspermidine synthase
MKDLKQFNLTELKTIEKFTEFLVDRNNDKVADFSTMKADDVPEQAIINQVKVYAQKRNSGKNFLRSAAVESDNDKEIVSTVREWLRRKRK